MTTFEERIKDDYFSLARVICNRITKRLTDCKGMAIDAQQMRVLEAQLIREAEDVMVDWAGYISPDIVHSMIFMMFRCVTLDGVTLADVFERAWKNPSTFNNWFLGAKYDASRRES